MGKVKKSHLLLTLIALVIVLVILVNLTNLKKAYIQFFNKNAIVKHYNNDGKLEGEFISYLKGKIYVKAHFNNGLRDGWATEYYPNGKIKNERLFEMGKEVGTENEYYEDGKLDYKANWENNKRYGSEWHWLENGTIAIYDTFDIKNLFYYSKYDNHGALKQALGNIISPNIYSKDATTDSVILLVDKDKYHNIKDLYVTVAAPPNLNLSIDININQIQIKPVKILDNTVLIRNAFPIDGNFRIQITGKLTDQSSRVIRKDSLDYTIKKN